MNRPGGWNIHLYDRERGKKGISLLEFNATVYSYSIGGCRKEFHNMHKSFTLAGSLASQAK